MHAGSQQAAQRKASILQSLLATIRLPSLPRNEDHLWESFPAGDRTISLPWLLVPPKRTTLLQEGCAKFERARWAHRLPIRGARTGYNSLFCFALALLAETLDVTMWIALNAARYWRRQQRCMHSSISRRLTTGDCDRLICRSWTRPSQPGQPVPNQRASDTRRMNHTFTPTCSLSRLVFALRESIPYTFNLESSKASQHVKKTSTFKGFTGLQALIMIGR